MDHNPENYRMSLNAVMVPDASRTREDRVRLAKKNLTDCMAVSLLKMDKFLDVGVNNLGDEQMAFEIFVFTREEINAFMQSVAETTAQFVSDGMPVN